MDSNTAGETGIHPGRETVQLQWAIRLRQIWSVLLPPHQHLGPFRRYWQVLCVLRGTSWVWDIYMWLICVGFWINYVCVQRHLHGYGHGDKRRKEQCTQKIDKILEIRYFIIITTIILPFPLLFSSLLFLLYYILEEIHTHTNTHILKRRKRTHLIIEKNVL